MQEARDRKGAARPIRASNMDILGENYKPCRPIFAPRAVKKSGFRIAPAHRIAMRPRQFRGIVKRRPGSTSSSRCIAAPTGRIILPANASE